MKVENDKSSGICRNFYFNFLIFYFFTFISIATNATK